MNTTAMLFLLTVLIESLLTNHNQWVVVGEGFWCDYQPEEINQVIAEHENIALTNSITWPSLRITGSVYIKGGYQHCLAAKLRLKTKSPSRISGFGLKPVIIINTEYDKLSHIMVSNLIIDSGFAEMGAGIQASGHFSLLLEHTQISNNTATDSGGGMFISGQDNRIQLKQTLITNNRAQTGGALSIFGSGHFISFENSHAYGNGAKIHGGGIACEGVNFIKIIDSAVSDNWAEWGSNWSVDLACKVQSGSIHTPIANKN